MRSIALAAMLLAATTLAACEKTGENTYEVERPVVGTTTDTIRTPDVDVKMRTDTVNVPTVKTEPREVKVPDVDVNRPRKTP